MGTMKMAATAMALPNSVAMRAITTVRRGTGSDMMRS